MTASVKTIREISIGVYDGPHATPELHDEGAAVFLGIPNLLPDGRIDVTAARWVAERDLAKWTRRVTPQPNDIVFTYEATLNRYAIIPEGFRCCLGRRTALIRPAPSQIDHRFLFYYFFSPRWRAQIEANTLTGATVDRIPLTTFPEFEVLVPELQEQKRIAEVLSAYDDLIATNQRRIDLLEDAARRLYREWFVHLRFPGHEQVEVKDGVPQGWRRKAIKDFVEVLSGFAFKSETFELEGLYGLVTIRNVQDGEFLANCESRLDIIPDKMSSECKLKNGDILISLTGNVGRCCLVVGSNLLLNQRVAKLNPKKLFYREFVYFLFRDENFRKTLESLSNGAAQQNLSPIKMGKMEVIFPPEKMLQLFSELTSHNIEQILVLREQNTQLAQARDLLLPKLMSGQLDVSGIRLPEELTA